MSVRSEDNVSRLQIAMKNSVSMRVVERFGNRTSNLENLRDWKWATVQTCLECASGDVFHDQKVEYFLDIEVEDCGNSRMRQPRQDECLAAKPLAPGCVAERAAQEHLDGDVAVEVVIVSFPDRAHAALTDQLEKAVSAQGLSGLQELSGTWILGHGPKLAALSWSQNAENLMESGVAPGTGQAAR